MGVVWCLLYGFVACVVCFVIKLQSLRDAFRLPFWLAGLFWLV